MGIVKGTAKRVFWPVFIVVFILVALFVASIFYQPVREAVEGAVIGAPLPIPQGGEPNVVENGERYGIVLQDEVWKGTVRVVGDVVVREGVTLTIEPGTTVLVSANSDKANLSPAAFDLKKGLATELDPVRGDVHLGEPYNDEGSHVSIFIYGTLNAVGTPEERITITSDADEPNRYNWNFFHYNGILSYATVEYYRALDPKGSAVLSHSILRHAGACAVCITGSDAVIVENNEIYDAWHELIDTHHTSATIRNNKLGPNPAATNLGGYYAGGTCIIIDGGNPNITGNTLEGCDDAISIIGAPTDPGFAERVLAENEFRGNVEDIALHYLE